MLVEDFVDQKDRVGLFHMKSSYDEGEEKVSFKYKFVSGIAPQSFGIFVAKIAGIDVRTDYFYRIYF